MIVQIFQIFQFCDFCSYDNHNQIVDVTLSPQLEERYPIRAMKILQSTYYTLKSTVFCSTRQDIHSQILPRERQQWSL